MTLHEVEETLATLIDRHPGLDEGALVTLLRAGGWEERSIQDAVLLFRSHKPTESTLLQPVEQNRILPEHVPYDHLLPEGEVEKSDTVVAQVVEPVSLQSTTVPTVSREDLPHNLPLRPFETSEHVWPFSRYKDVFYGTDSETLHEEHNVSDVPLLDQPEQVEVAPPVLQPQTVNQQQHTVAITESAVSNSQVSMPETSPQAEGYTPSRGDERLIILASSMLLLIVLLLGYLYGNGRL